MHKFPYGERDKLVSEERGKIQPYESLLDLINFSGVRVIGDLGCGNGYFTIPLAEKVKRDGKVFAVDISSEMLKDLSHRVYRLNLFNVEPLLSKENKIPLPDNSLDMCFMGDVFHELTDKNAFLKEVKRILRKGGILVLTDWEKKNSESGPPVGDRVSSEELFNYLLNFNFTQIKKLNIYLHHYVFTAKNT